MSVWTKYLFTALLALALVPAVALAADATDDGGRVPSDGEIAVSDGTVEEGAIDPNTVNPSQLPDSSFVYDTSLSELATADSYYNNQTVQVVGEVLGDAIHDSIGSDHVWIVLGSLEKGARNVTLSIYAPESVLKSIDTYGSYAATGTTLQVRGTFHLSCAEHDGATDLHATNISVVAAGTPRTNSANRGYLVFGFILIALGTMAILGYNRLRERER